MVVWIMLIVLESSQSQVGYNYIRTTQWMQVSTLTDKAFFASGTTLLRRNLSDLTIEEERVTLPASVVYGGLALTNDGKRVIVCLFDSTCRVYNASHLSAGPLRNISDVVVSDLRRTAVFVAGDTLYTGSETSATSLGSGVVLQQHGLGGNSSFFRSTEVSGQRIVSRFSSNWRDFIGGFVTDEFAYFFMAARYSLGVDAQVENMLRVCNKPDCCETDSCRVSALYEGRFTCGVSSRSKFINGLSMVDNFGGVVGTTAVIASCFAQSSAGPCSICLVNISAADEIMESEFLSYSNSTTDEFITDSVLVASGSPSLQCEEDSEVSL